MAKKISIVTLGCEKNTDDTANLTRRLIKKGYQLEKDSSQADAIVVHTCSFIESAKKESLDTIFRAARAKKETAALYVTGCMIQQHGKELMEEIPEADAFLGTGQLHQIADLLKTQRPRFLDRRDPGGFFDPDSDSFPKTAGATAFLRLSEGCSHPCSFCVIPKLRGGLKSRTEKAILSEVKNLARAGIREIVIIGQDTGEWGKDLEDAPTLPRLLRKIRRTPGLKWVRVMYMHPASVTAGFLDVLAESPDFFPYLDMPIQHIDNDLLMDMNRHLPEKNLRKLLDKIREKLPALSLRTTFIVGYPGETDAQFDKLNSLVNEGYFDYLGAFAYSREESTPAALKKRQIDNKLKEDRQAAIMATYYNSAHQKAQKRLGKEADILIEHIEGETMVGRTAMEAPEIDAAVRLPDQASRTGQFVRATLTGYDSFEYAADKVNLSRKGRASP